MSEQPEHPNPARWWKHRRRGYYFGIWWAIVQTPIWALLAVLDAEAVASLGVAIGWSYGIAGALIVAYFGNTAVEELVRGGVGR